MSYILEAIRKSEAQRKKEPPLKPIRRRQPEPRIQRSWVKLLSAAVVTTTTITIGVLAYFSQLDAWRTTNSAQVSVQEGASQPGKPLMSRQTLFETKNEGRRSTSLPFPSASNPSFAQHVDRSSPSSQLLGAKPEIPLLRHSELETPLLPKEAPRDSTPQVMQPRDPAPVVAVPSDLRGSPVSKNIPLFSELPSELRQRIPPIKVNVHAYSQLPQEQFVIVGTVRYRPGEQMGDDLVLEEVTRDGLVLRFQDQPFRLLRP